jgi:hypothetical protein
MKRRILYVLMGLALIASVGFGFVSPRGANADYWGDPCAELVSGIEYNLDQGNFRYAMWLVQLGVQHNCPQFV